jgi:hypothetical protein
MTFFAVFDKIEKIRYILSNHTLYNNFEAFSKIMKISELTKEEFDFTLESYWYTNNWWDDKEFINTLIAYGIDLNTEIKIKYDKDTIIIKSIL